MNIQLIIDKALGFLRKKQETTAVRPPTELETTVKELGNLTGDEILDFLKEQKPAGLTDLQKIRKIVGRRQTLGRESWQEIYNQLYRTMAESYGTDLRRAAEEMRCSGLCAAKKLNCTKELLRVAEKLYGKYR